MVNIDFSFEPRLSVSVRHPYFSNGIFQGLTFSVDPKSNSLLAQTGAFLKQKETTVFILSEKPLSPSPSILLQLHANTEESRLALLYSTLELSKTTSIVQYTLLTPPRIPFATLEVPISPGAHYEVVFAPIKFPWQVCIRYCRKKVLGKLALEYEGQEFKSVSTVVMENNDLLETFQSQVPIAICRSYRSPMVLLEHQQNGKSRMLNSSLPLPSLSSVSMLCDGKKTLGATMVYRI